MHDYLPAGFWPLLQNQSLKPHLCRPRELSVNPKQHNMPLAKETREQMRTKVIYQSGTGDKAIKEKTDGEPSQEKSAYEDYNKNAPTTHPGGHKRAQTCNK